MLESVQRFLGDFFGSNEGDSSLRNDPRKIEYGTLDDIRKPDIVDDKRKGARSAYKRRMERRNRMKVGQQNSSDDIPRIDRNRVSKQSIRRRGAISSVWKNLKTVFSNEEQDLTLLQQACGNVNSMVPQNTRSNRPEERRKLRERMARSEAFKRKLIEIKYDDKMLEQLRRGRSRFSKLNEGPLESLGQSYNITDDQITLLQRKVNELEDSLRNVTKELQITQKRLKFAQEKNTLLESLLDDANIDSEYVKSRRDMKNIQKKNLKPEAELPPSPRRTLNPLFTSSPMRKPSVTTNTNAHSRELAVGSTDDFYNKYPKIPETESLMKAQRTHSLSPIRIDYSKYSV